MKIEFFRLKRWYSGKETFFDDDDDIDGDLFSAGGNGASGKRDMDLEIGGGASDDFLDPQEMDLMSMLEKYRSNLVAGGLHVGTRTY